MTQRDLNKEGKPLSAADWGGMFLNRQSPYVIAEIGSNWSTLGEAIGSIGIAAGCGVDAVKFQLFSHKDLYGFDGPGGGIEPDWLPQLKEKAEACKVDFLCSAFSEEGVELVDKYVPVHKIAASEAAWPQLIDAVRDTGKPAIVTAGSLSVNEIMAVVAQFCWGERDVSDLCLLYGEPNYPSLNHNLFLLDEIKQFKAPVGLSDHSSDNLYTALSAYHHFGASVIEKHVQLVDGNFPDSCVSIDKEGLSILVRGLRAKDPRSFIASNRKEYREQYRRRLIATKDIEVGERFRYGSNYGAFRSKVSDNKALPAWAYNDLNARCAKVRIVAGEAIGPKQVKWNNGASKWP